MNKILKNFAFWKLIVPVIIVGIVSTGFIGFRKNNSNSADEKAVITEKSSAVGVAEIPATNTSDEVPVYANWKNFTTKDGLPSDKTYCIKIDGKRVLVGTHD